MTAPGCVALPAWEAPWPELPLRMVCMKRRRSIGHTVNVCRTRRHVRKSRSVARAVPCSRIVILATRAALLSWSLATWLCS